MAASTRQTLRIIVASQVAASQEQPSLILETLLSKECRQPMPSEELSRRSVETALRQQVIVLPGGHQSLQRLHLRREFARLGASSPDELLRIRNPALCYLLMLNRYISPRRALILAD